MKTESKGISISVTKECEHTCACEVYGESPESNEESVLLEVAEHSEECSVLTCEESIDEECEQPEDDGGHAHQSRRRALV